MLGLAIRKPSTYFPRGAADWAMRSYSNLEVPSPTHLPIPSPQGYDLDRSSVSITIHGVASLARMLWLYALFTSTTLDLNAHEQHAVSLELERANKLPCTSKPVGDVHSCHQSYVRRIASRPMDALEDLHFSSTLLSHIQSLTLCGLLAGVNYLLWLCVLGPPAPTALPTASSVGAIAENLAIDQQREIFYLALLYPVSLMPPSQISCQPLGIMSNPF